MQNFSDGKVPVGDNKLFSLKKYGLAALEKKYEGEELRNIVQWILEHFTGLSKTQLSDPDAKINQSAIIHFSNAIDKLLSGVPVQYVMGEVEFYKLKLGVDHSVLIPRPETEELVDMIVRDHQATEGLQVLDIGTGSGCIALSLAKNLVRSRVTALDISKSALEVAKNNALKNRVGNVEFLELDILKEKDSIKEKFDLIVSNPPYIASSESSTMAVNVLEHEPRIALFVPDEDPLVFYRKIAELALKHLKPTGKIYVEINEKLGMETTKIFESKSFSSIHLLNDLFGKNRFIKVENYE